MTEFEYPERLAGILASLQNEILQPLRSRLEEITATGDKSFLASDRELKQQTDQIDQRLQETLKEADEKDKQLLTQRNDTEASANALIRHYQDALVNIRGYRYRLQRELQTKGLLTAAEKARPSSSPPLIDDDLDVIAQNASQVFNEAQRDLTGPLASFESSHYNFLIGLSLLAAGFSVVFILLLLTPGSTGGLAFWTFLLACLAFWMLRISMSKKNVRLSDLPLFSAPKSRVIAAYVKLGDYVTGIEAATPKRVAKVEFEKQSKLRKLGGAQTEAKETLEEVRARYSSERAAAKEQHEARLEEMRMVSRDAKAELIEEFLPLVAQRHRAVREFWKQTQQASADWSDPMWRTWQADPSPEFAARVGKLVLRDTDLAEALPELTLEFELPALMPFTSGRFLLLEPKADAQPCVAAIQSVMLRALANVPPGKLRFTFIDPVGHGQSVAPFIALGDLDEQLISGGAWSESQHIEQQLAKLTGHMDMVIQKFLRNDYASIRDYNQTADEVAEAFRLLVIFDFPAHFSDSALRSLVDIIRNGPRCGIFTLMVRNTAKAVPYGFNFDAELRPFAFTPYCKLAN